MAKEAQWIKLMMCKSYFAVFFLVSNLVYSIEALAENIVVATSSAEVQLYSEFNELKINFEKHILLMEDMLQKQSDENRAVILDFKKDYSISGSILQFSSTIISVLTLLIAILTAIAVLAVPHYYRIINTLRKTEKKSVIQQQLNFLISQIESKIASQLLVPPSGDSDPEDKEIHVISAYSRALDIRVILQKIALSEILGEKDVSVERLCNTLKQYSDFDTEKVWNKELRKYLQLLLTGKFLKNISANQAIEKLLLEL